jgi:hypothetical protein
LIRLCRQFEFFFGTLTAGSLDLDAPNRCFERSEFTGNFGLRWLRTPRSQLAH